MTKSFIESTFNEQDKDFEVPIRPQSLKEFSGQEKIRDRLEVMIGAAKERGESLDHCLFCGPPGLGKTTLAMILSKAMETQLVVTSGPMLEKPGDLAGVLTKLKKGDVLFIDEIHRLPPNVEEYLYSAMEDFTVDIMIDTGANARTVQLKLEKFTLVGATTRSGMLSAPLRSRFPFFCRLEYYHNDTLASILQRTGRILNMDLDHSSALTLAARSRGTPRIANNLLRWLRDYSQMRTNSVVNCAIVDEALTLLAIDERGLDEMDMRILHVLIDHYNGGPVGIKTLAVAVGEEGETLEEVYEPFLILQGFIKRTPRGREATHLAYQHLGKTVPSEGL